LADYKNQTGEFTIVQKGTPATPMGLAPEFHINVSSSAGGKKKKLTRKPTVEKTSKDNVEVDSPSKKDKMARKNSSKSVSKIDTHKEVKIKGKFCTKKSKENARWFSYVCFCRRKT
jgi:hypothetical protein